MKSIRRLLASLISTPGNTGEDEVKDAYAARIDAGAADALWKDRDVVAVTADWKEGLSNHGRHSWQSPDVEIAFPDGRSILLRYSRQLRRSGQIGIVPAMARSAEEQITDITMAARITQAHRALFAERLAVDLCRPDVASRLPLDAVGALEALCIDAIRRKPPAPCTETYLHQNQVTSWSGERPNDPPPFALPSPWRRLHGENLIRTEKWSEKGSMRDIAYLSHPALGVVIFPAEGVAAALDAARRDSIEGAFLGRAAPPTLTIPGNAAATRLLALAAEALSIDPDLVDDGGSRIDTLLGTHVPNLLWAHSGAARTATVEQISGLDQDLARGIEAVRRSVDQALAQLASDRRDALRTQVAFLEMRTPAALGLKE